MAMVRAEAERVMAVEPARAYELVRDYARHRPRYLPPAYANYRVESGGTGAGTIIGYTLTAGGRTRTVRVVVAEPEPGSVLTESESGTSLVTTWTVRPQGAGTRVHIATQWQGAGGIGGFFERTFAPRGLKRLYDDELARLESYAAGGAAQGS
jgi:hypothetical protein